MKMITKDEVEKIVRKHIEEIEKLGDQSGGSGHMSSTSYELNKISFNEYEDGCIHVDYSYITYVETEFTYYPDNPPHEYLHERIMVINKDMKIISDEPVHELEY